MIGIRIFENEPVNETKKLVKFAYDLNLAVEVSFYDGYNDTFINEMLEDKYYINNRNKSIHISRDYVAANIYNEPNIVNSITKEIEISKLFGIDKGVIHYTRGDKPLDTKTLYGNILEHNLINLHKIAINSNFTIFVENAIILKVKNPNYDLKGHRIIWDTILNLNLQDKLGICLDWGHVKAFTNDSLSEWLNYVEYLNNNGMKIHMHLHDNDGITDLHIPLKHAFEQNYQKYNHINDKLPYADFVGGINKKYKDSFLILENQSKFAKENVLWLVDRIKSLK